MKNELLETIEQPVSEAIELPVQADSSPRYYSRFSLPQRYLHGVLAATFLGLAMTGLPLRFSSTH
ncbi:MAG TPA: hypothetical protein VGV35_14555, partial [Bryobacteraceae bacterium]|nr:hypothetical protein [Bryobacteraceae bacterium]